MTEMASPADVERAYVRIMRLNGRQRPAARRLDIQPPLPTTTDGETDCWTHAWELAERVDGLYVEGVCLRGKGIATHAWVETDTPLGPTIIETTAGYEQARDYVGLTIDRTNPNVRDAYFEGHRYSVIQLCLATNIDLRRVLA